MFAVSFLTKCAFINFCHVIWGSLITDYELLILIYEFHLCLFYQNVLYCVFVEACGKLEDRKKILDCGKLVDCGKILDCGKSMKSLINQVYNYMHFLYSQACLIRENAKNGNF